MENKRIKWTQQKKLISELKPHPKNPRIITDNGLKELEESFDDIGFAQPVNVSLDGTILSGHARIMQLQKEGQEYVDCLVPDRTLTPKQEEAVIVRMNKNIAGKWDYDKLKNEYEIEDLYEYGFCETDFPKIDNINFEPGTPEDQGSLDQQKPKYFLCPNCGEKVDLREYGY